jgi:metallo-beta-lactamase class B
MKRTRCTRLLCTVPLFLLAMAAVLYGPAPANAQNTQGHVYGAKTARPYTLDDYIYGRKLTYEMAQFRMTPNGPNTPGSPAYKSAIDPFKLAGNTYYVGVAGQGSYLITTKQGHILIEQPYDQDCGEKILASVQKLGFNPTDIKIITATEIHNDHMGATAYIKKMTGAQLALMEGDAEGVEKQYGIKVDRVLHDLDQIKLGEAVVTAYHIPGHTPGATTFLWTVMENNQKYNVAETCCWSNYGTRDLVNNPMALLQLRRDFEILKSLPVDIPTPGSHSDHFNIHGKLEKMKANPKVNPWIAPEDYRGVIAFWEKALDQEVNRQMREGPPKPPPPRNPNTPAPVRDPNKPGIPSSFPPFPLTPSE